MENSVEVPLKAKIELPYDPAIPLLGMYLEKILTRKETFTPVFITAPFPVARAWKHVCPPVGEWIKRRWCIRAVECHPALESMG